MKTPWIILVFLFVLAAMPVLRAQSLFQYTYQSEPSIEVLAAPAANGDILFAIDAYNDTAAFFHRIIVQRLDVQGNVLQTAGVFRPPSFWLRHIKGLSDNGMLLLGTVNESLSDEDSVFVTKLDNLGQIAWSKGFQVEADLHNPAGAIETSDGSYLVYGTYDHVNFAQGIFLMKITASGTLVWSRTINSQLTGAFMKVGGIVETAGGDYWLSGSTRFNTEGSWLAKLNSTGETQSVIFYKTHQLTESQPEPFALHQRSNGELDIFYNSTAFQSGSILLAVHADANGMPIQTTRFYKGTDLGEITAIRPTGDGGYLACGYTYPGNTNRPSGLAMKIASNYSISWSRTYGSGYIEVTNSIFQTSDGGIAIGGFADFDSLIISPGENGLFPWLIKTDGAGVTTCYNQSTSVTRLDTTTTTMAYQLDNIAGVALADVPFMNIPVNMIPTSATCLPTAREDLLSSRFTLYPNPSQGTIFIETTGSDMGAVELFDLFGRRIPATVIRDPQRMEIHTQYTGMAIVRVQRKTGVWSKKVIIQ